ncbi:MAG: hypothetical protein ABI678_04580 [Kofleriaceae bacterium]
MIRIALVLACITGCSGLEPLIPACGNGVVEPGEDCDSGPTCRACSLSCSDVACPAGYACGADQLCHAPGGRFRGETVIPFEEQGFGITDINQDHYGDIVALGGTSLTAYYGDATASLSHQLAMITPTLLAQPAVAHLDPDSTLDIVLPTLDGLLAYTSPFQVPSPYPFPIDVSMGGVGARSLYVFPLDGSYLGLLADDRHGGLVMVIVDGKIKNSAISTTASSPVCAGMDPGSIDPRRHDLYATSSSFLFAVTGGDGSVCEVELKATVPGTYAVTTRVLPGIHAAPTTNAVFAHLGLASECPSLVVTTPSGIAEAPGTGTPGTCKTLADHVLSNLMAVPLARVPLGAGVPDALATYAGIFEIDATGAITATLYVPTRPVDTYVTVDINGDGALDVIASSPAFDDLDVLIRYGSGASGGFLAQAIDTLAVPLNLVTGDFDGDGVGDITYSEKLPSSERLMIVFGGHDDLHPPRLVSTYKNIVETNTVGLTASSDPTGTRVRDLIVLDRPDPDAEPLLLTVLFGSPQRTLLPFFDPRPTNTTDSFGFRGAVAGVFGSTPGEFKDLFAVEETSASASGTYVYLIEPDALGAMKVTGSTTGGAIQNCTTSTAPSGLCIDGSVFSTYRANAATPTDLVVGFDTEAPYHVAVIDPTQLASDAFSPRVISLAAMGLVTTPGLIPHQLFVADVDGDGTNELVAGFAPAQSDDLGSGAIITCHPTAAAITCEALVIPGWSCGPAAPANVVRHEAFGSAPPRTSQDLVAACVASGKASSPELVHLWWDGSGFQAAAMFALPASTRYLETGDITGDGLGDVLVFDRDRTSPVPLLHVYPQCTSRDADACRPLDGESP